MQVADCSVLQPYDSSSPQSRMPLRESRALFVRLTSCGSPAAAAHDNPYRQAPPSGAAAGYAERPRILTRVNTRDTRTNVARFRPAASNCPKSAATSQNHASGPKKMSSLQYCHGKGNPIVSQKPGEQRFTTFAAVNTNNQR